MKVLPRSLIALGLLAGLMTLGLLVTTKVNAAGLNYDPSNLMSQEVFTNSSSMSQGDIQNFLAAEGSGLASYSQVSNCYNIYMKYNCGQNESAAEIIAEAANSYGINPQVILATLQKEQSLITTPNPTPSQLAHATGYGCPDSGGCDSTYYGFFNQVDWAAWQLAYDTAASSGNSFQGTPASSYPCQNPTRYYSAGLLPGNTVTFIDDNGVSYSTFTLANASTAALYCYTPHTYNNPQGLYNLPTWGTVGDYYSGSYWFEQSFYSWFGNYADAYAGQSGYPSLNPGQSATVYIEYKNIGNEPWYDDTSLSSAPSGTLPVHLATDNPINRCSQFGSSWVGCARPALNFSAVYESDGSTLATNQQVVQPGEVAKFSFTFTAPYGIPAGFYKESFQPVLEGTTSTFNDVGGWLGVTINPIQGLAFYSQNDYATIDPDESSPMYVELKNTGSVTLYDDTSIANAPSGTDPVHLSTDPVNTPSDFSATWPGTSRPAVNFSAVYNSDGTTLAANQHTAQPGQIIKFSFTTSVPAQYAAGSYKLAVQPILEGASGGYFPDLGIYGTVTVPTTPVLAITNNSPSPNLIGNQPGQISLGIQNVGNATADTNTQISTGSGTAFQTPDWQSSSIIMSLPTSLAPNGSTNINIPLLAPTTSTSQQTAFSCSFSDNGNLIPLTNGCSSTVNVSPASYSASYYGESGWPSLLPGQQTQMYFEYKNTGNEPWYDDTSLPSATWRNAKPTHLATADPMNRISDFDSNWPGGARPNVNFNAVYESDGTTLAADQHVVQPGQIAKFSFNIQVPMSQPSGTYQEHFEPVIEGTSGLINYTGTWEQVQVSPAIYTDAYAGQSGYPTISAGSSAPVYIMYKNTGNEPWYDDASIGSASTGTHPVHLATSHPLNRNSQFSATWIGAARPALNFSAVYESDGTTLAADQHVVQPGQIAKYSFTLTAPSNMQAGYYQEYFQPILEGTWGTLNDPWTWLGVTVTN